jgi:hypothetical protein
MYWTSISLETSAHSTTTCPPASAPRGRSATRTGTLRPPVSASVSNAKLRPWSSRSAARSARKPRMRSATVSVSSPTGGNSSKKRPFSNRIVQSLGSVTATAAVRPWTTLRMSTSAIYAPSAGPTAAAGRLTMKAR